MCVRVSEGGVVCGVCACVSEVCVCTCVFLTSHF